MVSSRENFIRWSVVIPAYNEEKRLPTYLHEILPYFDGRGETYEVIVVDDGSQDRTASVVERFQTDAPSVRLIKLAENRGKGCAVRTGMLEARGRLRLFTDADGATPIRELEKLERAIAAGADIAVGSRTRRDPTRTVETRAFRKLGGALFNIAVRSLGVTGITDTQCGFKLFRTPVAQALFSVLQCNGFSFDVEMLFLGQQWKYRIAEIPVQWTEQAGSKVHVVRDGLRMLYDTWTVRRKYYRGFYPTAPELGLLRSTDPPTGL